MLTLLNIFDTTLPVQDPVLRFLIVLIIVLAAPLLLNEFKIPHLLGLIIAGAIIGPNGINLLARDSSIVVTGTTGLLYIMFLAGLEIDLAEFKRNSTKSIVFGLYTFLIPMTVGILASKYLLNFTWMTSILLASLFASHTLISYPIVSKAGVAKNSAVTVTVGGTMITDTLALMVLAIIVGMNKGVVNTMFWIKLLISTAVFGAVVMLFFPIIGRWFFKRVDDKVSQYIFVLVMMYLGAVIAELAGIEAIIGAFLAGLALNRLIPHTSTLMNRVEFVGNAYFIPFFLISVGMLIDYKAFFKDFETIKVALVMTIVAMGAKYLAALAAQKTYRYSIDQRRLIFGLSSAQAAATLAAVMVGYNIIIAETETGEPIRLLSESVLNGSILMILVTCTVASFVAQKGSKNIAAAEAIANEDASEDGTPEKIMVSINHLENAEDMVQLGITIKSKNNNDGLFALNIVDNTSETSAKQAKKIMELATNAAVSADRNIQTVIRHDKNVANGIVGVVKENEITDIVLGITEDKGISSSFLGNLTDVVLKESSTTTLIYKPAQPLATIKRHLVIVPANAELEEGFALWLLKLWNLARNTGATIVFYAKPQTLAYIQKINEVHPVSAEFKDFAGWDDFLIIARDVSSNDNLVIVLSRNKGLSYNSSMAKIPAYLNKYFKDNSYIIIFPIQKDEINVDKFSRYTNPSLMGSIEKLDEMGQSILKMFKVN